MNSRKRTIDDYNRWSKHLPDELIEMIVKRLTLVDSRRFAAVCPSWRRVSSQWFQRVTRLPWLLNLAEFLDSEYVKYSLYSPSEGRVYNLKFRREDNNMGASRSNQIRCSGSVDGWLIMSEWASNKIAPMYINYFLNPMTGDRIKLPQLTEIPWISAASSDPRCSNCIVAVIAGDRNELVFCRPSSHISCIWQAKKYCYIKYVKFHEDGKLYAIGEDMDSIIVLVLDPLNHCQGKGKCEKIIACKENIMVAGIPPGAGDQDDRVRWFSSASFIWSSKGEVLLVWQLDYEPYGDQNAIPFYVFKIDRSGSKPIWAKTNDVDEDQVIFVSASHSTSMSMSKLAESFMTTKDEAFLGLGCGTYCICYNWDEHNRLGVFACNLADKTCSYLSRSGLQHAKGDGSSKDLYISHGQHRRLQVEIDQSSSDGAINRPPDESWTHLLEKDDEHMAEIKFQDGKLYAMGREYVVVSDPLEVLDQ